MTLIVGCRYRNKYILAADGRVTNDTGIIESNTCQKIEAYENYVMAGAGTCNTPAILKKYLFDLQQKPDPIGPLDAELSCLKIDANKETVDGSVLLLELHKGKVTNILNLLMQDSITVQNLLTENQQLITLGTGADCFTGIFKLVLEARVRQHGQTSLPLLKDAIRHSMQRVADINVFCNDQIDMQVFDIKKDNAHH